MSKKSRKSVGKKSTATSPKRRTTSKSTAGNQSPMFPVKDTVVTAQDPFYQKLFKGVSLGVLLIMLLMAFGSGVNQDDEYQNDYSTKLVNYYATMGSDTSALHIEKGNMHFYGGFFDLTTGVVNNALGLDYRDAGYHQVRHLFNALLGFLGMLFTALLAKEIAGWRAGILTLLLMFLSPRFLGHSFMNPKDIPFAAGFAIALYYMVRLFRTMPKPDWRTAVGVGLGMALAISSRAGGLLLIGYLGLFAGIDFLMKYGLKNIGTRMNEVLRYAIYVLGISMGGYILAILFWPFALVNPIAHPLEALTEFAKLGVKIRLLFQGENIMSDATAWHYPIQWIWRTIPLFTLIGFIGSMVVVQKLIKSYWALPVFLCFFAAIFPVFYVIAKESIIHDGWRHLMFVYPPMVVLASLFWVRLEEQFQKNKTATYAIWGILGLLVLESLLFIVRNPQYPYTYFNTASGGISSAFGNYETDYWGVSVKQSLDWMKEEGILSPDRPDTIRIATTFLHNLRSHLGKEYQGKVKTTYVRYNQRYEKDWDYGIFPSRFYRGPHLRSGNWPNSKAIHVVKANGVPLTVVEDAGEKHVFRAEQFMKQKDFTNAIEWFKKEVEKYPDNELAWTRLAMAYVQTGQLDEAQQAADQSLKIAPDNVNALFYKGMAMVNQGKRQPALELFRRTTQINNDFSTGYYYMAMIQSQENDLTNALKNVLKAIEISPRFKPAYELAANLYEKHGNPQRAAQYREAIQKIK